MPPVVTGLGPGYRSCDLKIGFSNRPHARVRLGPINDEMDPEAATVLVSALRVPFTTEVTKFFPVEASLRNFLACRLRFLYTIFNTQPILSLPATSIPPCQTFALPTILRRSTIFFMLLFASNTLCRVGRLPSLPSPHCLNHYGG